MDNHRQKPWAVEQSEVLTNTKTTETGLTEDEVRIRQQAGLNELAAKPLKTVIQMVKEQIFDPMIGILLVAASYLLCLANIPKPLLSRQSWFLIPLLE